MELEQLQAALQQACDGEDWDAAHALRQRVATLHPNSDEAAEATYRLGLDALFRLRDLAAAQAYFEQAAKMAQPYWSAAARTSMALCYAQQKRPQKAMLELRKVAHVKEPTVHSVVALTWMEMLSLAEANGEEAAKARVQRIAQLKVLLSQPALPPRERGEYLYQLGCALLDQKQRHDGRSALEQARSLGAQAIGPDVLRGVNEALKG